MQPPIIHSIHQNFTQPSGTEFQAGRNPFSTGGNYPIISGNYYSTHGNTTSIGGNKF